MSQVFIYGLTDPRTNEVRYIGKTTKGMSRPIAHGRPWILRTNRTHRTNWINKLASTGVRFGIVVLEYCTEETISDRERAWIAWARQIGWNLTNHTDGGEGVPGYRFKEEQKKRIGEVHKGKTISPETRSRISKGKSRPVTDTTTGITYSSITEACQALNLQQCNVHRCLTGKQKQTKGHSFVRADVAFFLA